MVDKDVLMKWKQLETETLTVWQVQSMCIIYSRSKGCIMRQHEREKERERGGAGVLIYLGASGGFAHWAPSSALPLAYWGSQGIPQTPGISIDPPINKS